MTMRTQTSKDIYRSIYVYAFCDGESGGSKTTISRRIDNESSQYYNEIVENLKAIYTKQLGNFALTAFGGFAVQQDAQTNVNSSDRHRWFKPGIYNR